MTLRDLSACVQIPVSTLSKVEHDRLTLSFHRLNKIADRLGIRVTDLFIPDLPVTATPCRRRLERRPPVPNPASSLALFSYLTHKRMTPTPIHLHANTTVPQLSNTGEHFLFVLRGSIDVHTRYYTPTRLNTGDSLYFDSEMLLNLS